MIELPASIFTFENYGPFQGYSGFEAFNHEKNTVKEGFKELGRCDSKKLHLRPKESGQAIMIFDEQEKETFWIHVINIEELLNIK